MTTPAAEGPPVRVKICGLRDEATLDAALAAGADWIGFQQFERSPRYITPDRVATLVRHMDRRARSVVLFVEPTDDEVARLLGRVTPDVLQIYASEDRACALRERFGVPVWHARGVAVAADLPHATPVDGLLIESRAPAGATRPGGNGVTFDWAITRDWVSPVPWLLAGGLTPGTVAAAIRASRAPGVDVSSGVESAPGVKDPQRMVAFVRAARAAWCAKTPA